MSFTSKGTSEILVAGLQDMMFTIDIEKGTVTKQVYALAASNSPIYLFTCRYLQQIIIPS